MITLTISGPKDDGKALAKQIATLLQHQHKVVKTYDADKLPDGPVDRVDVLVIIEEE